MLIQAIDTGNRFLYDYLNKKSCGRVAQLVRAPRLHRGSPGFESLRAQAMLRVKLRIIIFLILFLLLTGVLGLAFWPFIKNLQNPQYREMFSVWVAGLGFKGILVLFGIQVLQIVVAVIPGGPVELIAGAAYGVWKGILIVELGCAVATILVFSLVRKFGLPLVRRFFGDDMINTWGFLSSEKKTALVTFVVFLIPGTPKDILTYLVPLSRLSLVQFTLISVVARFPMILSTAVMGDAAMQGKWVMFLVVFGLTAVTGILGIQLRERFNRRKTSSGH